MPWQIAAALYIFKNRYITQTASFFVCSFVATWLCLYFRCYWLLVKDPIENQHRFSTPWVELHVARAPSILLLWYADIKHISIKTLFTLSKFEDSLLNGLRYFRQIDYLYKFVDFIFLLIFFFILTVINYSNWILLRDW